MNHNLYNYDNDTTPARSARQYNVGRRGPGEGKTSPNPIHIVGDTLIFGCSGFEGPSVARELESEGERSLMP